MKKILILTAGFGEGHNSAAHGIRAGLLALDPSVQAEIHDVFAETFGPLNLIGCRAYLSLINRAPENWALIYRWLDKRQTFQPGLRLLFLSRHRLAAMIKRLQPDAIVSVYPAYAHLLDEILGPVTGKKPKRVICITDSISVNAMWYRCSADYFLVANEQTADVLVRAHVAPEQLRVTGFPVNPKFAELSPRPEPPPWRILYTVNARKTVAPALVQELAAIPNTQLTVTVGRDEKLRRAVEAVREKAARKFEVVGWTSELPQLLGTHHLLITKAGGATVQEAVAARCPMIVNQIIPGQEKGNAQLITETNSGSVALTQTEVVHAVNVAFAEEGKLWRIWSQNIATISRPAAARAIAEFLCSVTT